MIYEYRKLLVDDNEFLLVDETKWLAFAEKTIECKIFKLIINDQNFIALPKNKFLAMRYCAPVNTLTCLGTIKDNGEIFYLYDLFKSFKNSLFLLDGFVADPNDPIINFAVKRIHQLNKINRLNGDDYLYFFRNTMLYKISYEDFLSYFDSFTKCGEYTGNTPNIFSNQFIIIDKTNDNKIKISLHSYFKKKLMELEEEIKSLTKKIQNIF
jgi:hypothetical protein